MVVSFLNSVFLFMDFLSLILSVADTRIDARGSNEKIRIYDNSNANNKATWHAGNNYIIYDKIYTIISRQFKGDLTCTVY